MWLYSRTRHSRGGPGWERFTLHGGAASLHEGAGRFVIDGRQGRDVADELVQERRFDEVGLLGDERFLR